MAKRILQILQDISSPKGTITLDIKDIQGWIDQVKAELEDKAETYTQALINEVLINHFQDTLENEEEDEGDDEEEEPTEGTSRQDHGSDDDDQDDPPSGPGPSSGGAATKPTNPSDFRSEPPPKASGGESQGTNRDTFSQQTGQHSHGQQLSVIPYTDKGMGIYRGPEDDYNKTLTMEITNKEKIITTKEKQLKKKQALINEVLIDHFRDTLENEEDEGDDDEEEPIEGTSGQDHGSDNDDQDDLPSGSSRGAATEPTNPSDSLSEPPPKASGGAATEPTNPSDSQSEPTPKASGGESQGTNRDTFSQQIGQHSHGQQLSVIPYTGNGLLKGEDCEFNTGVKECPAKKSSAKYFLKVTPKVPEGLYSKEEDRKGKKTKPMAGLVPNMVGDKLSSDASEFCRARSKVRDQTVLIFFDVGTKANFISPTLGIRPNEMGYTAKASLACLGHSESVTLIIGKLHRHIQSYVDEKTRAK
ncbi:hypothetical protein L7F22_049188 [Adiantum nelumboides]|nr:hypothetical protein [Adiantum nelumboides]